MRVGLALYLLSGFPVDAIRGIARYARPHRPWTFDYGNQSRAGIEGILRLKPDGILVTSDEPSILELLRASGIPSVNMHHAPTPVGLGHVSNDDRAVGRMAAEYFLARGYRRFAFYCLPQDAQVARLLGFSEALREAGFSCDVFDEHPPGMQSTGWETHERKLGAWLEALPKPAGILCLGDHYAFHLAERCRRLGLQVPNELALLGVDNDLTLCLLSDPPLSSVQTDHEHMGYLAAGLLDAMMSGRKPQELRLLVPPLRVVERRSTDAVAASDRTVAEALRYMKAHLRDVEGMYALSERLHCSRRGLERRFKQDTGLTPAAAWTRFRIEEARRLLLDTEASIGEVAEKAGFTDLKHLNLVFKKATGLSPGQFRRRGG